MTLARKPEPWGTILQIAEHISSNAPDMLREKLGDWTIFDYRNLPRPTLRLFINPRGRAAASIARTRRGTLITRGTRETRDRDPRFWYASLSSQLRDSLRADTMRWAMRTSPTRQFFRHLTDPYGYRQIKKAMTRAVDDAIAGAMNTANRNGEPVPNPRKGTEDKIVRIIQRRITDPATEGERAESFNPHSQQNPVWQYNHIVINRDLFRQMKQEAPMVLAYYFRNHGRDPRAPQTRFASPAQVTSLVQQETGLEGIAWRLFTRTGWNQSPAGQDEGMAIAFRALAQANRPNAPTEALRTVLRRHDSNLFFHDARWDHGDPWRTWVHVVNRFLHARELDPRANETNELAQVADTLRWHVQEQQPWGPADWETCLRRSQRWHEEQLNDREEASMKKSWQSLLDDFSLGSLTASPITNGRDLASLARTMGNCLATYIDRCQAGTDRIFTLRKDEGLLAAGQIYQARTNRPGEGESVAWSAGQIEAPGREDPGEEARQALQEIAARYQEAWDRAREP